LPFDNPFDGEERNPVGAAPPRPECAHLVARGHIRSDVADVKQDIRGDVRLEGLRQRFDDGFEGLRQYCDKRFDDLNASACATNSS
jgi:hypothetical protein